MELINKNSNFNQTVNWSFFLRTRLYTFIFISIGLLFVVSQVLLPFYLIETAYSNNIVVENSVLGASTGFKEVNFKELAPLETNNNLPEVKIRKDVPKNFLVKIPKINIEEGLVHTNSFDMNPDSFIGHYAGTALPGEVGNVFLYGHSVMPFFFKASNYKTIFSNLHKLEDGDLIEISFADKVYKYKVFEKEVLDPKDVKPLETITPAYLNDKTLSLMTCTPPGTTLKRLIVGAKLID